MARPPHVPQPETELEEFFDLSIDPLSIIGFDGEFKRVNESFLRLLGYTKPELFSRTALEILHAGHAEVTGSLEDGMLRIEVRDNGAGGADPDGQGLVGMRDRVTTLGGRLGIDSPDGGGTLVAATLPLSAG